MNRIMDKIDNEFSCVETNNEWQINDTTELRPQYSSDAEWYFKYSNDNSDYLDLLFLAYRKMGISPTKLSYSERELVAKVVSTLYELLKEKK